MNKPKKILFLSTVAIMLSLLGFVVSCNKEKDKDTSPTTEDTGYAADHATSEQVFDDAQNIADKASGTTSGGSLNYKTTGCATVTHSGTTITVDFGAANCLCADGRNRRGKVIINYTGTYADSGSTHTITFDNFYQNDNKVEGTKTVTNMGHNSIGQPYFNITVSGAITRTSGATIASTWSRVRTWTAGYATPINWTDDVYSITGSGTITRAAGTVNVTIPAATPLIVALNCRWIEAGSVIYTLPSGLTRTLNYGSIPVCDDQATLTLPSGSTSTITLP